MIILRGEESQSLPNRTALPNAEYAGEGMGMATAGQKIASTATHGIMVKLQYDDQAARTHGFQEGKRFQSKLLDDAHAYWDEWDQTYVQQGKDPREAINAFGEWFKQQEANPGYQKALKSNSNPYLSEAYQTAYQSVREDVLAKARPYARSSWLKFEREGVDGIVDKGMQQALFYDAQGDHEGFLNQAQQTLAYLDSPEVKGRLLPPADVEKRKEAFKSTLSLKRAMQLVAREPKQFLDAYHNNEFGRLDPKDAKELVTAADQSLARKVTIADHNDKAEEEALKKTRTAMKNDLINLGLTNPAQALAQASRLENRSFLGPEYDNTVSTLRAMASNPGVDNPAVFQALKDEVESHPTEQTKLALNNAIKNGQLQTGTYGTLYSRLTERLDKLTDKRESDRHKLLQQEISTRLPMFDVGGIMDKFDEISNTAKGLYRDELQQTIENDPKANVHDTSLKLFMKYKTYSMDSMTSTAQAMLDKYGFKDIGDIALAYQNGTITRAESDPMIWLLTQGESKKPTQSSSNDSQVKKPKKGSF